MYGKYIHMHPYSTGYIPERYVKEGFRQRRISCCVKKIMIAGIRFYQKYLSPLKTTRCPYIPTCSAYGLEAIQKYGAWKGGWLAIWRIMRCNPFSHGGYDPVP